MMTPKRTLITYLSFKNPPMITQVTPSQMTSKTVIVLQTVHLFQNQQNLQKNIFKKIKPKHSPQYIEERKKIKRIKNKISAKRSRERKKTILKTLIEENTILKQKLSTMTSFKQQCDKQLCPRCHSLLFPSSKQIHTVQSPLSSSFSSSKYIPLFTTFIVLICLYYKTFINVITNYNQTNLRNLRPVNDNMDFSLTFSELKNFNLSIAGWVLTYGDYYMITRQKVFLNQWYYFFKNQGQIRLMDVGEAESFGNRSCSNCLVELNKENIIKHETPLRFTLMLFMNKFWNKTKGDDGLYYNDYVEKDEEFLEVKCEIIGIAKNTIYSDKNKTREDIYNK